MLGMLGPLHGQPGQDVTQRRPGRHDMSRKVESQQELREGPEHTVCPNF